MSKLCYNCGKEFSEKEITREHIPSQNLYTGFSEEFKKERIVVSACNTCNNLFSKTDQEIRDVLAVKSEDLITKPKLAEKGIRSIKRDSKWLDRLKFDDKGNVISVDFKYKNFYESHKKNFKGLFYHKYGLPISDDFQIEIIADEGAFNKFPISQFILKYLEKFCEFEQSGHADIFKFKIGDLTIDENQNFFVTGNLQKCSAVAAVMIYHNCIMAIVFAGNSDFFKI